MSTHNRLQIRRGDRNRASLDWASWRPDEERGPLDPQRPSHPRTQHGSLLVAVGVMCGIEVTSPLAVAISVYIAKLLATQKCAPELVPHRPQPFRGHALVPPKLRRYACLGITAAEMESCFIGAFYLAARPDPARLSRDLGDATRTSRGAIRCLHRPAHVRMD